MIRLILRADDIGYSEAVNYGIEKTIKQGLIQSAGLMPNMPSAQHGWDLVKDTGVCIGQHTNVCLGKPCADPSLIPSLLDENGNFKSSRMHREAFKNGKDLINIEEAILEVEAQYRRFKEITGKEPEYFEAHAIASRNLGEALRIVAERYDLPFNNCNPMSVLGVFRGQTLVQLPMESMLENYDPFDALKRAVAEKASSEHANVFVCHPGYLDDVLLRSSSLTINRTKEVAMLCDPAVKTWLDEHNVECISYNDVK